MNRWAALVGRARDGKSQATQTLIDALTSRGLSVGGFYQEPVPGGYDVINAMTGERRALAREAPNPILCSFAFDAAAFDAAAGWALRAAHDVTFVELGKLEAAREGHWATFAALLERPGLVVAAIKPSALASMAFDLPDPEAGLELPCDEDAVTAYAGELLTVVASIAPQEPSVRPTRTGRRLLTLT